MNVFSRSAQAGGEQKRALAGAVAGFALSLIGAGPPMDTMFERVANRHASLGIQPEQYTVVGRYLMRAVGKVLGDAVTPEVAAAWDEVYWLMACKFIGMEARLYATQGVEPTSSFRDYEVSERHEEAFETVSFVLTPVDGAAAPHFRPGQYVTLAVDLPDGGRQLRQYSLSQAPGGQSLRITVRRVRGTDGKPDGLVSGHLIEHLHVGSKLPVSPPFGNLTPQPGQDPLLLISAGVGITPMARSSGTWPNLSRSVRWWPCTPSAAPNVIRCEWRCCSTVPGSRASSSRSGTRPVRQRAYPTRTYVWAGC